MKNEINDSFYCSAGKYKAKCSMFYQCYQDSCASRHRKHPTPEQYKEEYGEEYPDNSAVYALQENSGWFILPLKEAVRRNRIGVTLNFVSAIVCACTPFGKPDDNWRPE
jgi:hypothetical protein